MKTPKAITKPAPVIIECPVISASREKTKRMIFFGKNC